MKETLKQLDDLELETKEMLERLNDLELETKEMLERLNGIDISESVNLNLVKNIEKYGRVADFLELKDYALRTIKEDFNHMNENPVYYEESPLLKELKHLENLKKSGKINEI